MEVPTTWGRDLEAPARSREVRSPALRGPGYKVPAAAGRAGVGVVHLEAALLERVHEVEGGAREIQRALLVDDDPHAPDLHLAVGVADLIVEGQLVAQPRAASPHHLQAQAVGLELALRLEQAPDPLGGRLRHLDEGHTVLLGPNSSTG
jgi:hypothetical protein